jgi:hypothetical protein
MTDVSLSKVALIVLTVLNAVALAINISLPTKAAVGAKSYEDLLDDPDFTLAVQAVIEKCKVNLDIAKLQCGPQK